MTNLTAKVIYGNVDQIVRQLERRMGQNGVIGDMKRRRPPFDQERDEGTREPKRSRHTGEPMLPEIILALITVLLFGFTLGPVASFLDRGLI